MSRVFERSASQAVESGSSPRGKSRRGSPLPTFVPPQLSQSVEKPPSGSQWLHEIKLDGYRMAARIDNGRVQLLTRTGLDWTDKYSRAIAALANLNVKTAYIDGELCGVDEAGLPTFAHTQAATDGERNVQLVYYAFDLLHLDGWDISGLQLNERKALTYAGRVGTGMPVKVLADLRRRLDPLARKTSPLSAPPSRKTRFGSPLVLSRVHWVEPKLVAEITYLTWTADNLLRHTVYVGLREDKPANQVRREIAGG
jgi:ATP-dependent DNA ligase